MLTYNKSNISKSELEQISVLVEQEHSEIYLTKHKSKDELYAVKVMYNLNNCKKKEKRYKQEMKIHSKLDHHNIIKCYGNYVFDCKIILILDYMPGGDMRDFQIKAQDAKLPEDVMRSYLEQILAALKYLHKNRIIHRDIKPENMLLSSDKKTIKICDFGLSIIKLPGVMINDMVGTVIYAAPDILKKNNYGYEVDIWSLSVCMFEFSVGFHPFECEDVYDTFDCIKKVEYIHDIPKYNYFQPFDPKRKMPANMEHVSLVTWDLIDTLIRGKKYKTNTIDDILKHPFFVK